MPDNSKMETDSEEGKQRTRNVGRIAFVSEIRYTWGVYRRTGEGEEARNRVTVRVCMIQARRRAGKSQASEMRQGASPI